MTGRAEKKAAFLILLIAAAIGLPIISSNLASIRDSAALSVSPQDFDSLITSTDRVAVFFSTTGCASCDEMRPLWQMFSEKYGGSMRFIEVQYGLMTSSIFDRYDVLETPTFVLFVGGANVSRYDGGFASPYVMDQFLKTAYGTNHAGQSTGGIPSIPIPASEGPPLLISIILGISVFGSPCVLPLVPGYLAILFAKGRKDERTIGTASVSAFVFGAAGILLIGLGFIILGDFFWSLLLAGRLLMSFALLVLGLASLLDVSILTITPKRLKVSSHAARRVATCSFLFGLLSLGCSIPFLAGALLNILAGVETYSMMIRLLAFAVGFALPLAALTFAVGNGANLPTSKLAKATGVMSKIGGFSMIVASLLLVITL